MTITKAYKSKLWITMLFVSITIYHLCYIGYVFGAIALNAAFIFFAENLGNIKIVFMCFLLLMFLLNMQKMIMIPKKNFFVFFSLFCFTCYHLFRTLFNNNVIIQDAVEPMIWVLILLNAYLLFYKSSVDVTEFRGLIYICFFVLSISSIPLILLRIQGLDTTGAFARPAYFAFTLFPFVFTQKKDKLQLVVIVSGLLLLISTTKRTGIIACFASLIVYYFLELKLTGTLKQVMSKLFKYIIGIAVGLGITAWFIEYTNSNVIERFMALSRDGGSSRDIIWSTTAERFSNFSWYDKLFGRGYLAVSREVAATGRDINAHNDFIEFLYDYGYIGLILLTLFWISLVMYFVFLYKRKSQMLSVYGSCLISLLIFCLFSYGFVQSTTVNFLVMFIGFVLAKDPIKETNEPVKNKKYIRITS